MGKIRFGRRLTMALTGFLAVAAVLGLLEIFMPFGPFDQQIPLSVDARSLDKERVIAHAMGAIDGVQYSNCLEAFLANYNDGFRTFEVDLMLTADDKVVAMHDGLEKEYGLDGLISGYTVRQFKGTKFKGIYTPLDLGDIIALLVDHGDAVLVPDVKSDFKKTYDVLVHEVEKSDPEVLKRIIPQIYKEEDFKTLKAMNAFNRFIFTLYRVPPTSRIKLVNYWIGRDVLRFLSEKEEITTVTMFRLRFMKSGWLVRKLRAMGRDIMVHTLNEEKEVARYLGLGATGIYTDDYTGWIDRKSSP